MVGDLTKVISVPNICLSFEKKKKTSESELGVLIGRHLEYGLFHIINGLSNNSTHLRSHYIWGPFGSPLIFSRKSFL